jgi:hypothetical protein
VTIAPRIPSFRRLAAPAGFGLVLALAATLAGVPGGPGAVRALTNEALLDTVQHTGVLFFWNEANPANGLIKDRDTPGSVSSIASTGFGLSALTVGVDRGWLDRNAVKARVLTTLNTFWTGPQGTGASGFIGYQGLFYHWLDMNTARRTWDSELSTIDTALLMAGILDMKHYWNGPDPDEVQIRALADSIYLRCNWDFMRNHTAALYMGWKPGTGFSGFPTWIGYNEAMILYLLALGSPTHPINASLWGTWLSGYDWETWYGQSFITFPPLFGHQYSHCWIDFRDIADNYTRNREITYFENSRRATLVQRAWAIDNPFNWVAYSDSLWGFTASDDPAGYKAHGTPPAWDENGTITPTAGISSLPFAPEVVLPLMHNLWNNWRGALWGPYGFTDAFNPSFGWIGQDVLGIDQGPIVLMIENYRTGAIWNRIEQDEYLQLGLSRANFRPYTIGVDPAPGANGAAVALAGVEPNPFRERSIVRYRLARAARVHADLVDVRGRVVARLLDEERGAGEHALAVDGGALAPGLYHVRFAVGASVAAARLVRVR